MKTLLLISILFYSLQFASCKTTAQTFATPQYPRNAELQSGNYGGNMYSATSVRKQALIQMYYTYCDTARIDGRIQIQPTTPAISSSIVAIAQ